MKPRKLTDLRDEMRAVARGDAPPSPRPAASMTAALTREALDLLEVMIQQRPANVADVARLTNRAQPNVSRSLQQLSNLGLVRLERRGREVRPEPLVRSIQIDLKTGTYETRALDHASA